MDNKRRRREDFVCDKNRAVPDIIPLNKKDNDSNLPTGDPVYEDESSVDSLMVHPPTESEGYFVSDNADYGSPNSPYPVYIIPSLSQPSPSNTFQEGDISLEGAQSEPKCKYQRKNGLNQFGNKAVMGK